MSETTYDVLIVGGGAAGLSAALVLTRARRRVAVIDAGQPRNAAAAHMHGFLSRDGMPPGELLGVGRREVSGYGGELIDDQVITAERDDCGRGFRVELASGRTLCARRLMVTSGLRDELPALPGVRERWGRDVLHCPYCHGYEVADQLIGILGGTEPGALERAVHLALLLPQWSGDVVFFPHTMELSDADRQRLAGRGVKIVDGTVAQLIVADDQLRGVELTDGSSVLRSAVFVASTMVPDNTVLNTLGCELDAKGWVVADPSGRTSVPGVWVAGNVTDPRQQVITAAGAASATAIALNADLVDEDSK